MAELYDPFSIVTLCLLEEYGFCDPGTAGKLVRWPATPGPAATLPTNTGGGQLSGFYLQGMTPLAEAIDPAARHRRRPPGPRGARRRWSAASAAGLDHHAALVLGAAA